MLRLNIHAAGVFQIASQTFEHNSLLLVLVLEEILLKTNLV
jgi:hypothetical protein